MKASFLPYAAMIMAAMCLLQCANVFVKSIHGVMGPAATAELRLGLAALIAVAVTRPWRLRMERRAWLPLALYGLSLGFMVLTTYYALCMLPVGVAVAAQFSGPLAVALLFSRRWRDFLWIALAVLGLILLLPLREAAGSVDFRGLLVALLSGVFWAVYLVAGKSVTRHVPPLGGAACGMLLAALCVLPFAVAESGVDLVSWTFLKYGLLLACVTTLLPYPLEIIALGHIPSSLAGMLQSLHPVVGAVFGVVVLGEHLPWLQWAAVLCIVAASVGCSLSASASPQSEEEEKAGEKMQGRQDPTGAAS